MNTICIHFAKGRSLCFGKCNPRTMTEDLLFWFACSGPLLSSSSSVGLQTLVPCRTLASFDLLVNMFQKLFTSLVGCLQYRFSLYQVHKFFYRHIVDFFRGNFPVFFKHLFWKNLSLTSSALQVCQHSALYSKMDFTRLICRWIYDALVMSIRRLISSLLSISTDDGSEIFGLPYTFSRFFFNVFDINKFYFFLMLSF